MNQKERVELRPASTWDCPECGRENFERMIVAEMTPEDLERLKEDYGDEAVGDGEFVTIPNEVQCKHCGEEFGTKHFRDE